MPTARAFITRSLRSIGALSPGQPLEAEEAADGLIVLNAMLAQLRLERLMVYAITRQVFSLVSGDAVYTYGIGGQWNAARPTRIERASFKSSSMDLEIPAHILTLQEYQAIAVKGQGSQWPAWLYVDYAFPLINVTVYPVPASGGADQAVLYTWGLLEKFANLSDEIEFPDGYEAMIYYNLAIWLAPDYERPVSEEIRGLALSTKARIKSVNSHVPRFTLDAALRPRYRYDITRDSG